jgi:hypothetical protein
VLHLVRRSAILATIVAILGAANASAYSYSMWPISWATESPQNYTCVSASAVTQVDKITGSTNTSNALVLSYYSYGRTKIRYNYSSAGLDPRAWAWTLYNYTPAGYTFNEYGGTYSGKYTQSQADSELVATVRETHQPAGALVDRGRHAFDIIGFSSTQDPELGPYTLNGFYIVDPWYPMGTWTGYDSGTYGLAPDTYITASNWNAHYLRPYSDSQFSTIWDTHYIVVLRMNSSTGQPSDTPVAGPWSDFHGAAAASPITMATDIPSANLENAVREGLVRNQLTSTATLGVDLHGVGIGASVPVTSLDPAIPSYWLVELRHGPTVAAIALVEATPTGYVLAAVRRALPGTQLPKVSSAPRSRNVLSRHLVWGWSAESSSPFFPLWREMDPSGHQVTLGLDGNPIQSLRLDP